MRTLLAILLLAPAAFPQSTAAVSFSEYFDSATSSGSSNSWTINSPAAWWSGAQLPGLYVTAGLPNPYGNAYANFAAGSGSFTCQADVYLTAIFGALAPFNSNGLAVALTTGTPGSESSGDSSIIMGAINNGIYTVMTTGDVTGNFGGTVISGGLTQGASAAWPQIGNPTNPYWRWTFQVSRDSSNHLTWNVYTAPYQSGSVPIWTQTFTIPSGHASDSYQKIVIQSWGPNSNPVSGSVNNLRCAGGITGGSVPTVTSIIPSGGSTTFQSGNTATITGTNFDNSSSYSLRVGVAASHQTVTPTYVNSTTLTASLPTETNGSTFLTHLIRNGIDSEYYPGIAYSAPVLNSISPFEVLPTPANSADATVQFYGQGFDGTCAATFAGTSAAVSLVSPIQLSVIVPNGSTGIPRIILTCASSTVYDSSTSSTYPPSGIVNFGYSPHPYMQWTPAVIAATQAKWGNSDFANYKTVLARAITGGGTGPGGAGSSFDYGYNYLMSGTSSSFTNYLSMQSSEGLLSSLNFYLNGYATNIGNQAMHVAEFYDAFFSVLTPSQRAQYENYLVAALSFYWYSYDTSSSCFGSGTIWPNRMEICNGGAGTAAVALYNSLGTISGYTSGTPYVAKTAATLVSNAVAQSIGWANYSWMADGGYVEGSQYAQYGGTAYLIFAQAVVGIDTLLGISPADRGIYNTNYKFAANWLGQSLWDGVIWTTFNDTFPIAYEGNLLLDVGSRFSAPNLIYMADYLMAQWANVTGWWALGSGYPVGTATSYVNGAPYMLILRSNSFPSTFSGFNTVQVNASVNQAILRSDSTLTTPMTVSIKGKSNHECSAQHAETDQGSFTIQSNGEEFMLDPGYFIPGAVNHSTISIDGNTPIAGPTCSGVATFDTSATLSNANFRSAVVVATNAYTTGVSLLRRTWVLYSNGSQRMALVLDDVHPTGTGNIISYWQSLQPATITVHALALAGTSSNLAVAYDGPAGLTLTKAAGSPSLASAGIGYTSLGFANYSTISATYSASTTTPMVTSFTPSTSSLTASINRGVSNQITISISDGAAMIWNYSGGLWSLTSTSGPTSGTGGSTSSNMTQGGGGNIQ